MPGKAILILFGWALVFGGCSADRPGPQAKDDVTNTTHGPEGSGTLQDGVSLQFGAAVLSEKEACSLTLGEPNYGVTSSLQKEKPAMVYRLPDQVYFVLSLSQDEINTRGLNPAKLRLIKKADGGWEISLDESQDEAIRKNLLTTYTLRQDPVSD